MIRADSRVNLNHTPIRTKAEWTQKSQRTKNYSRQAILEWINQLLKVINRRCSWSYQVWSNWVLEQSIAK
jgi:hypothetical protein